MWLQKRREGQLAKLLGRPLPDELERMAEEDVLRAEEGLVELMDERGQIIYKHIDDLAPEDRLARIRVEGARIKWIAGRRIRSLLRSRPRPGLTDPPVG